MEGKETIYRAGKMRGIVFLGLYFCTVVSYATITPLRSYTGEIESNFRSGTTTYTLSGTTTDGYVQEFDGGYPYAGGMAINQPGEEIPISSSDAIQIATLFVAKPSRPECWAKGSVEGTITIEETSLYPKWTPLELVISYGTGDVGNLSSEFLSRGAAVLTETYGPVWYADHSTNGYVDTFSVQIYSGMTYRFYIWQILGKETDPVVLNSGYIGSGVALDLSVIPEPATLLLCLGCLVLTRRRK